MESANHDLIANLRYHAYRLRLNSLRMTTKAGSGHLTSALSAADIIAALFFNTMNLNLTQPGDPSADHFILSKGHAAPVVYAAYHELGLISDEELLTYRDFDSELEGHPTPRFVYTDVATGSLGMGLSIGAGMALEAKLSGKKPYIYVMMGDSETAEGSVWEAAHIAAFYKLNRLIGIIDVNKLGQSTQTMQGYHLDEYAAQWSAFGWHSIVINGHDMDEIVTAFTEAHTITDKPVMIIAKTIKGYGLRSIEGKEGYHGKALKKEELASYIEELNERFNDEATMQVAAPPICARPPRTPVFALTLADVKPSFKANEQIATRKAFGMALATFGAQVPNLYSLDAEVKNSTYAEIFEAKFPARFVQCFIAEQNMVSMGVGFAARNAVPVISTFGTFFSRAFDQLRMAAIGRAPLRLVGSHAGVSIGEDGPSQMALEDIALMRTLPDSVVLYPADAVSTFYLVRAMLEYNTGISYLRTTRSAMPMIYTGAETFTIGGSKVLRSSDRDGACIVAAGITLHEALKAYDELMKDGTPVAVIDCYSIKPLDVTTLRDQARHSNNTLITVEDHYHAGGLGEAVAAALVNDNIRIINLAVNKLPRSGKAEELLRYEEIDAAAIVRAVKQLR